MITNILFILLVYFAYIALWLVINIIAYSLSLVTKKKQIQNILSGISIGVIGILNFGIGISLLIFTISLFLKGEILWFIVMIFIGYKIITQFLALLQIPFILITGYFEEKIENIEFDEDYVTAEVLDESGNVLEKLEDDTVISRRLAKFFLANYLLLLGSYYIFPNYENKGLISNVLFSAIQVGVGAIFVGLFYVMYYRIKYGVFFPKDKRLLYISILKIELVILVALNLISFLGYLVL